MGKTTNAERCKTYRQINKAKYQKNLKLAERLKKLEYRL